MRTPLGPRCARLALAGIAVVLGTATLSCGDSTDEASTAAPTTAGSGGTASGPSSETSVEPTSSTSAPPPGTVLISDYRFVPKEVRIASGESVTWVNEDEVAHWVISTAPDVLDSGDIGETQQYSQTFVNAGSYPYFCNIHNYMKGTVTVG